MNKQEFIEGLRRNLSSINDYTFVNDTILYYENYIESQIRMGKTEAEVMGELGDPRLIAKSIRATRVENSAEQETGREFEDNSYGKKGRNNRTELRFNGRQVSVPAGLVKALGLLILLLVFWVVFTVLRWLSPVIIMGCVVYLIYKFFVGKY